MLTLNDHSIVRRYPGKRLTQCKTFHDGCMKPLLKDSWWGKIWRALGSLSHFLITEFFWKFFVYFYITLSLNFSISLTRTFVSCFNFFFFSNLGLLSITVQLSHSLPSSCTLIYTPSIVWGINDLVHFSLGSGFLVAQIRTKSIYFKQKRILFKKVIGIYQRLQGKGKQVPQQIVTGSKSH